MGKKKTIEPGIGKRKLKLKVWKHNVSIGIPLPRFSGFEVDVMPVCKSALNELVKFSEDRDVRVQIIPKDVGRGLHVARNHTALANAMVGEWLLTVGSDHDFHPASLCMLLDAAMDKDGKVIRPIISGICPSRSKPWRPIAYRRDETGFNWMPFRPGLDFNETQCMAGAVIDKPYGGAGGGMDIACGSGFCLYHRSVFDAVPYPWFDAGVNLEDLGNYGPDIRLCVDAHRFGLGSAIHLGVVFDHYEMQAISIGRYIQHCNQSPNHWMAEIHALNNAGINEKSVQDVVELHKQNERQREELEREEKEMMTHAAAEGEGDKETIRVPVHVEQRSEAGLPRLEAAGGGSLQQVAGKEKETRVA